MEVWPFVLLCYSTNSEFGQSAFSDLSQSQGFRIVFFAEIDSKLLFLFSIERERFRGHKITLIQKSFCLKLHTTFESRRTVAKNGP